MIRHLSGAVLEKGPRFAILEAGGIGYQVFAADETLRALAPNGRARLWIHHAVREDSEELFGFLEKEELRFFELLLNVPGIGPKSALNILNVATVDALRRSVASGETAYLTKISGIGKKTAEKIVLELKEKIGAREEGAFLVEAMDALEALRSLGYSHAEAREALKQIPEEAGGASERVKLALKILSGGKR